MDPVTGCCEHWDEVPEWVTAAASLCREPASTIKSAVAGVLTAGDVGYYYHLLRGEVGLFARDATAQDLALCKAAASRALGEKSIQSRLLTFEDLEEAPWIKVAYSPTLRRAGELLNFFPGHYVGGIPNAPSPLASTLTGGLVGAGLGYGAGYLAEKALPESWRAGNLRKTFAVLGGAAGAAPGAAWMASAHQRGVSQLDGGDLAPPAGSDPTLDPKDTGFKAAGAYESTIPLSASYREACVEFVKQAYSATGFDLSPVTRTPSILDVHTNTLGQVLWESGASPALVGTTIGMLRAASTLPGGSTPGVVTPSQLGRFAMAAGTGYATGALVGAVLGALTGLPASAKLDLKRTGALLGVVEAAVPAIFGQ